MLGNWTASWKLGIWFIGLSEYTETFEASNVFIAVLVKLKLSEGQTYEDDNLSQLNPRHVAASLSV
jgi:hypothetical protein